MVSGTETTVAQDTVRVRGTIERLDGSTYVVKARDGAELKVALADNPQIAGVVKASLSDIKQGSFVGVMAVSRSFLCERRTLSLRDSRRAYAFRPIPSRPSPPCIADANMAQPISPSMLIRRSRPPPVAQLGRDDRGLCCYSRTRGNQSAIDGMKIKSATKTKSATKNGSVPM